MMDGGNRAVDLVVAAVGEERHALAGDLDAHTLVGRPRLDDVCDVYSEAQAVIAGAEVGAGGGSPYG